MAATPLSRPVTVLVSRRVKPGREAEFEDWLRSVGKVAVTFPGHQGVTIIRPTDAQRLEYLIIFRFDAEENLKRWQQSKVRADLISRSADLAVEPPRERNVSGLETWFSLPGQQLIKPPPRWKMWALSSAAIYPLTLAVTIFGAPVLGSMPLALRFLIIVPVLGVLLTWIVMPVLTKLLFGWLYP